MRVLVTGADGFIGRHLVRELERAGHELVPAVYGRAPAPSEVRVDLSRPVELARLPGRVDAVVHAAGNVDPHAPRAVMFAANVLATRHLLAWAREHDVGHFVHCSSVAVYGPLTLGEERDERTARLGLALGLPYMRTKALAERAVEQSGVPYTVLRPPVVIGAGDTVISRGFRDALTGAGLPLLPGASPSRRVSLSLAGGLAAIAARVLEHGPLQAALHAVDAELSFGELAGLYAKALGRPCHFTDVSWKQSFHARNEAGLAWLAASARFGQHYRRDRLVSVLGYRSELRLESAIQSGISGLQGGTNGLF